MNLSFLNPLFWMGALVVGAAVWLHLRRKQEKNLFRFSAVRFLEDQPEPRQSPLRLRDLLLLAVRSAAVLLLAGAFAWPYVRSTEAIVIRESRVYLLDNTLSHQAEHGFTTDRGRILQDLSRADNSVQIAVIELTSQPKVITAFGDPPEVARQKVRQLEPSFQRGSFLAAFHLAQSLLDHSLGQRKRIVLCSDSQENQWTEQVSTPAFLKGVELELPKLAASARPNLWLSDPRLQRIFLGAKSLVYSTVKLGRVGGAKKAHVTLRANGQIIFERSIDLTNEVENILLQAQWEADPALWLRGDAVVQGQPDALAGDNQVFFTLSPLVEGKIALLAQSPYLRLALSPEVMRGQWATRPLDPANLKTELAGGPDAEVLCIESRYLQSSDARKLLWRYHTNGRGVLLWIDRLTPVISGFLREIGFNAEASSDRRRALPEKLQFVAANHPLFHPFVSPEYGNLLEIEFRKFVRLKSSEAIPLAFSDSGAPLLFQSTRHQGKLYVAAFGLDRESTSWPIHATFIPFLDLALQAARADDSTPANFEPGELAAIPLPPDTKVREIILWNGRNEIARAKVEGGVAKLRTPGKPGVFTLSYDDKPQVEKAFSVNPSPKESELSYLADPEPLKLWQTAGEPSAHMPGPARPVSRAAILQQRWWWWALAAASAALVLEMLLADCKSRSHENPIQND